MRGRTGTKRGERKGAGGEERGREEGQMIGRETHDIGVGKQTSFMFLTIAIVPILVSTIAFLPKSRIPWPLPAFYGKRNRMGTDGRRKSIHTGNKNREDMTVFFNAACSSLFIWSLVWYSVYNFRSFNYDGYLKYLLTKNGADLSEGPPRIQQMHKVLVLITITFIIALLNSILPIIPSLKINLVQLLLLLVSCGHPINVWYHCRLGLIHDASASEYEGIGDIDSFAHDGSEPCPSTALTS
ncbi:hypothetical protein FSP39_021657 [Pinctada imbricata]|uniref:Uncharacterized protein n=1 Tax=Pinctada imbricata TaxID=66713 RepID=A0AA89BJQ3_PINIB|nr:hypothetical protein FSP39_021657 [Pinctada imbricata]